MRDSILLRCDCLRSRPLRPRMDVALLLFLIFLNALFAMSEMALTASRKARLQVMVEAGDSGAQPRDGAARQPDQVPLGGADRHHLDRHPERHRRRRRVLGAVRRTGCTRTSRSATAPPSITATALVVVIDHLPEHHLRRAGAQAHRPDVSRRRSRASSRGRWSGCRLLTRPFVRLLTWCTEATLRLLGMRGRPRPQRHRGRDRRQPRGRARRRRHRGAGAPDGAQRVSPRRPPGRLDDDPARRDRLARSDEHRRRRAARHRRRRALALPGLPRRPRRRARRHHRAEAAAAARSRARRSPSTRTCSRRCSFPRRSPAWSCSSTSAPRARRSSSSSTSTARCRG